MTSSYRINYQLRSHKRDGFIEFIKSMLSTAFVVQTENPDPEIGFQRYEQIIGGIEDLINDHIEIQKIGRGSFSALYRLVPTVSIFFTPLPLRTAFKVADSRHGISARKFVPPSFNDVRRILNTAQTFAIAKTLKLITFDGDMTLYADGQDFESDSVLVGLLIQLLKFDLNVAVVTAAGYGHDAPKYEGRLSGLLKGFKRAELTEEEVGRFWLLGGECNFLFRCDKTYHLQYVPESEYQPDAVRVWSQDQLAINKLLDIAQENFERCVKEMALPALVMRKEKAIGLIPKPTYTIFREQLDEVVLSTQHAVLRYQNSPSVQDALLPFCAFNGGSDVWVDIGNKLIGVQVLQDFLGAKPAETLHVGDQFLSTGNDYATRAQCCTLWIINPQETARVLEELVGLLAAENNSEKITISG